MLLRKWPRLVRGQPTFAAVLVNSAVVLGLEPLHRVSWTAGSTSVKSTITSKSSTLAAPSQWCGLQRVGRAVAEVLVVVAARDGRTLTASAHERKSAVPSTHLCACVRVQLRVNMLLWQWHGWLRDESLMCAGAPRCVSTAAELRTVRGCPASPRATHAGTHTQRARTHAPTHISVRTHTYTHGQASARTHAPCYTATWTRSHRYPSPRAGECKVRANPRPWVAKV